MNTLLTFYKPRGMTPLQAIRTWQKKNPRYQGHTLSYAGRLDPMAEGLLLVLVDEENKKREAYENLEKEYEFTLFVGITTDTYDVLGKIQNLTTPPDLSILHEQLKRLLPSFTGKILQPYPPYSSFHVQGKPLFAWAREGRLADIQIPTKDIEIKTLSLLSERTQTVSQLVPDIVNDLRKVEGNFRQEDIIPHWQELLNTQPDLTLPLFDFTLTCTSGTYVRSLAYRIGQVLGYGALALRIKRTKVGEFTLDQALSLGKTESLL